MAAIEMLHSLKTPDRLRALGIMALNGMYDEMDAQGVLRQALTEVLEGDVAIVSSFGADSAVICTASQSNAPIEQAVEACRDRARMVDVGITKIELPWRYFSEKEIEFRFSRSYGPGRYDYNYEWGGNDYPIVFVRWTEQRNFEAVLDTMADGRLDVLGLVSHRFLIDDAPAAYQVVSGPEPSLGILLEYPVAARAGGRTVEVTPAAKASPGSRCAAV